MRMLPVLLFCLLSCYVVDLVGFVLPVHKDKEELNAEICIDLLLIFLSIGGVRCCKPPIN